tara:strand:- start:343 stop:540 length:198 start_codon:yes stop_codon:yes gene_type:complete
MVPKDDFPTHLFSNFHEGGKSEIPQAYTIGEQDEYFLFGFQAGSWFGFKYRESLPVSFKGLKYSS